MKRTSTKKPLSKETLQKLIVQDMNAHGFHADKYPALHDLLLGCFGCAPGLDARDIHTKMKHASSYWKLAERIYDRKASDEACHKMFGKPYGELRGYEKTFADTLSEVPDVVLCALTIESMPKLANKAIGEMEYTPQMGVFITAFKLYTTFRAFNDKHQPTFEQFNRFSDITKSVIEIMATIEAKKLLSPRIVGKERIEAINTTANYIPMMRKNPSRAANEFCKTVQDVARRMPDVFPKAGSGIVVFTGRSATLGEKSMQELKGL